MARKFDELRNKMSPESRARADRLTAELLAEMPLHELRRARLLSQEEIAECLSIQQPAVSKIERNTDMYISTLRRFIEAMGGELNIEASFPEGKVSITRLGPTEAEYNEDKSPSEAQSAVPQAMKTLHL